MRLGLLIHWRRKPVVSDIERDREWERAQAERETRLRQAQERLRQLPDFASVLAEARPKERP